LNARVCQDAAAAGESTIVGGLGDGPDFDLGLALLLVSIGLVIAVALVEQTRANESDRRRHRLTKAARAVARWHAKPGK
jgi:hypothetical protein